MAVPAATVVVAKLTKASSITANRLSTRMRGDGDLDTAKPQPRGVYSARNLMATRSKGDQASRRVAKTALERVE